MRNIYAALDLGSSSIKLVLGEVCNRKVNILEVTKVKSAGFRNGVILDQTVVANSIKEAVATATKSLGVDIESVLLSVPPKDLRVLKAKAKIKIMDDFGQITKLDVSNVLEIAKRTISSGEYEVVTSMPTRYLLDNGATTTEAPLGIVAKELGVETYNYTIPTELYNQYLSTLRLSGLKVISMKLSSTAIADEAITSFELEQGAILIDMGHHTTSASVYINGKLLGATVIDMGGRHITNDIQKVLGTDIRKANSLKHKYARIGSKSRQTIHKGQVDGNNKMYTIELLSKVVEARVAEIMDGIQGFLTAKGAPRTLPTVLVGGSARLKGLEEFISKYSGLNTRVYTPDTIGARDSALVSGLGMVYNQWLKDESKEVKEVSIAQNQMSKLEFKEVKVSLLSRLASSYKRQRKARKAVS